MQPLNDISIKYEGKTVAFRIIDNGRMFMAARRRYRYIDVCPLCLEKISSENQSPVILVISNQAGIPNRILHSECMEGKTAEYAFELIADSYAIAMESAHWFPDAH